MTETRAAAATAAVAAGQPPGFTPAVDDIQDHGDEGEHDHGECAWRKVEFLADCVCVGTVCAYLVPRRVVAVERTCRAARSGVEVGNVWSAQGPVQAHLLRIVDCELAAFGEQAPLPGYWNTANLANRLFAEILKAILRRASVRDVLMFLSDVVRAGPSLSGLSVIPIQDRWVHCLGEACPVASLIWAQLGDDSCVCGGCGGSSAVFDVGDGGGPGSDDDGEEEGLDGGTSDDPGGADASLWEAADASLWEGSRVLLTLGADMNPPDDADSSSVELVD